MTTKKGKGLMQKVLFLEISGFISLGVTMAVLGTVLSMNMVDLSVLWLPFSGLALVLTYIILTIRYTRRDIHKIHELHSKHIYAYGRFVMNIVGIGLMIYGIYVLLDTKEIWTDIVMVVLADLSLVIGLYCLYYNITIGFLIKHEHLRHGNTSFWDLMLVVIAPIAFVGFCVFKLLSTEAVTVAAGKADFVVPAAAIIAEFEKNDTAALTKYHDKIVQFPGRIQEISGDSAKLLKLSVGLDETTANCGFDASEMNVLKSIKEGDSVLVKCYCSGYSKPDDSESMLSEKSLDLVRCALVQSWKK